MACLTCLPQLVQNGDKCVCYNPSSFYLPHSQVCLLCLAECLTCIAADTCTSCKSPYTMAPSDAGSCVCPIPLDANKQCQPCATNCLVCTSPTACLVCSNPLILTSGACACPASFALIIQSKNQSGCYSCSYGCMTCTEYRICTACLSTMTLNQSLCFCPDGNFADPNTTRCQRCPP